MKYQRIESKARKFRAQLQVKSAAQIEAKKKPNVEENTKHCQQKQRACWESPTDRLDDGDPC